tara:strand:- start:141 stop:638 length:498 start_codon:yes stop_codon:yes gene_type:complete
MKCPTLKRVGVSGMDISKEGVELIKKFEGCKLETYQCSANVLTIGYGSTKGVQEGDKITQEEAENLLIKELQEYCKYVNDAVTVPLEQNQFDALVSWTYNLGPSNLKSSTMLKVLNGTKDKAYKISEVPTQIKRWNRAGGKVSDGLIRRREAEALMFQNLDWHEV